jgi:hypothetical protein
MNPFVHMFPASNTTTQHAHNLYIPIHTGASPMPTAPTVGRIVSYTLSEQDARQINRRRLATLEHGRRSEDGTVRHVGSEVRGGEAFPLIVTRVWGSTPEGEHVINGQLILDGNDTHWLTSVKYGTGPGTWKWAVIA